MLGKAIDISGELCLLIRLENECGKSSRVIGQQRDASIRISVFAVLVELSLELNRQLKVQDLAAQHRSERLIQRLVTRRLK